MIRKILVLILIVCLQSCSVTKVKVTHSKNVDVKTETDQGLDSLSIKNKKNINYERKNP